MADSINRKACDRCHSQKLSCKRVADEACERCIRLQTECKSSPSLRYKKQYQHQHPGQSYHHPQQHTRGQISDRRSQDHPQQQQQPLQPQQQPQPQQQLALPSTIPPAQTSSGGAKLPAAKRSPKRRRTDSETVVLVEDRGLDLPPESSDEAGAEDQSVIAAETVLSSTDFDFGHFEQLDFFGTSSGRPSLSRGPVNLPLEGFQVTTPFPEPWTQQLNPTGDTFHPSPAALSTAESSHFPSTIPTIGVRGVVSDQTSVDKRRRSRPRNRPRHIAIRHVASTTPCSNSSSNTHWMAQLSEINSRLLELASILPQPQMPAYNTQLASRAGGESDSSQSFSIDEMFELSRKVVEALEGWSQGHHAPGTATAESADPGNSMFVLSTYVRLLDMYQKVFSLVRMELPQADSEAAFRFWRLPDVRVGSFSVDPSPFFQMSLTIQMAQVFLTQLRAATVGLDPALSNGQAHSMFSEVVGVSYQAVKSKEESLGRHLTELREEIEGIIDH